MGQSQRRPTVSSALVLALGAVVLVVSAQIPPSMLPHDPGPGFLPMLAGAGLVLCGLANLFGTDAPSAAISRDALVRVGAMLAVLLLYTSFVEQLGFVIATPLFLAAQLALFGNRRVVTLIVYPVAFTLVTYLLFRFGLEVALPRTTIGGVRI